QEILVQIAGLGTNRLQRLIIVMTLMAFVGVGNLIGEIVNASTHVRVADVNRIGNKVKSRFSLAVVPNVWKRHPCGSGMHEEACFDQALLALVPVNRKRKGLR